MGLIVIRTCLFQLGHMRISIRTCASMGYNSSLIAVRRKIELVTTVSTLEEVVSNQALSIRG